MCVGCIAAKYQFDGLIEAGESQMHGHGVKIEASRPEFDEGYQDNMLSKMKGAVASYAGRTLELASEAVAYTTNKAKELAGYETQELVYQP